MNAVEPIGMMTPASLSWRGTDGRTVSLADFQTMTPPGLSHWKPRFVVVHNTDNPMLNPVLAQQNKRGYWHSVPDRIRLKNLETNYRDGEGWLAGPHLFVHDQGICLFTPLNVPGTHSPSWNAISWGVETVGNYDLEPMAPQVWSNLVGALAVLHQWAGLDPTTFRFHREDPLTTHKTCPGTNLNKPTLIAAVQDAMAPGASQ
jgi:hypothetical protein